MDTYNMKVMCFFSVLQLVLGLWPATFLILVSSSSSSRCY